MFTTYDYRVTIDRPHVYTDTYTTHSYDMAEGKFRDLVDDAKSYGWDCHITFDCIEITYSGYSLTAHETLENRIGEYRHDYNS